ncbi:MAG: hypothetical protein M1816_004379 [Peltula sp. TS41687]|nr:MAG: hypothetical protein M1816_004379 [Peltula sp. TS41687]
MTKDQRKKYHADNKTLLKYKSFGCLLYSNEIMAFATVDRNEDLLAENPPAENPPAENPPAENPPAENPPAENPPIILLQIFGDLAAMKALISLKTAYQQQLEFVLVDIPFLAYEPVLRRLQEKTSLPLSHELLGLVKTAQIARSPITLEHVVGNVKRHEGRNLRDVFDRRFISEYELNTGSSRDRQVVYWSDSSEGLA